MSTGKNLWWKGLAMLLASACTVTVSPYTALAMESVAEEEHVLEVSPEVVDEAWVDAIEPEITEEAAESIDAAISEPGLLDDGENSVQPSEGSSLSAPTPAELGKEIMGTVQPGKGYKNAESGKKIDQIRFDTIYYSYNIEQDGIYRFKIAEAPDYAEFTLACSTDYWKSEYTQDTKYSHMKDLKITTPNVPEEGKELALHKGNYWLEAYVPNGYSTEETESFKFTLSLADPMIAVKKDAPESIELDKTYSQKLYNHTTCAFMDENYTFYSQYYQLTVEDPGTLTLLFKDDLGKEAGTILNVEHTGNAGFENEFKWNFATNKFTQYASTSVRWLDKETVRLSLPQKGTYRFVFGSASGEPTYTFKMSDWTPLKDAGDFKAINDTKLGGSNDWPYKGNTDWGEYYSSDKNGPMPDIEIGQKYRSIMTDDSPKDYFHFKLDKEGPLYISLASEDIGILDYDLCFYYPGKSNPSTGEKEGSTEDADLCDHSKATASVPLDSYQLSRMYNPKDGWIPTEKFPAGDYILYINPSRDNSGKDDKCGRTGIYSFMLSTSKGSGGFGGKKCPVVITKQKVNLYTDEYFGITYNKKARDKWVVSPKANGSVSNGIFTAKNPTTGDNVVTVTRRVREKNGRKWGYRDAETISFKIETPEIEYEMSGGSQVKTFNRTVRGSEVNPGTIINCSVEPAFYECSDKNRKNFDMDENTGIITVKNSGTCKLTAYYCRNREDKKNAAKVTLTVKATLPTMKLSVKLKPTKSTTLNVTKVRDSEELTAEDWEVRKATYDSITKQYTLQDEESDLLTLEPQGNKRFRSCKVTAGSAAGVAAVVVSVGGVEYYTFVNIK